MPAPACLAPILVVELRRYRLRAGRREDLIDLFDREFVETQEDAGMHLIGQFRDLDVPDSFVWLRGFSDMASRENALQAFYSGPVWAEHRDAANGTMVNSDNVLLLRPLSLENAFWDTDARRPSRDAKGRRPGLVVATVAHLAPRTDSAFADFFIRDVSPVLSQAGALVLGTFVAERSENTFPRLPVREGETVFVWFSLFRDEVAYDAHIDALAALRDWTDRILPEMDGRVWRPNEISRLTPTARSLIHGEGLSSLATNTPRNGGDR
ncbi:NIPSNAP family protein [Phyllobacterium salinisoli]|uniref:NIPSNAP family protein n=1 Tax=Phyllobacterium salinisoli TaxID=1899321 RepID=A0A368K086_9HYPH|nr:NIPSNAP family protein [Phyllobacterium salinisoli]RCS21832.1 NIPSNAP family protein [Phyllobacterium salinisoli]